ncbi:uncharacterized protein Tco025E_00065 [Trypanosoma conorhini]|uniref:Uncharacterized protein n=1 Tax=Trypanosoma conorhini TaxID=83891 RepID=A0A3R7LMP1_9TRYP|nr:uncharacterized protein Tco025E_00065 [Trypanosoma conorhini]RNF27681.1 hypothetical protein Tco025E_00065 [Trypanosoma conorhini]
MAAKLHKTTKREREREREMIGYGRVVDRFDLSDPSNKTHNRIPCILFIHWFISHLALSLLSLHPPPQQPLLLLNDNYTQRQTDRQTYRHHRAREVHHSAHTLASAPLRFVVRQARA